MYKSRKLLLSMGAMMLTVGVWSSTASAHTKTMTVKLTDKGFEPSAITARTDEPIHLHVVNAGTKTHQFSIPHYHIFSQNIAPGTTDEVEFIPWEKGNYEMMSDPSGDYNPEFQAKFIVK